MSPVRQDSLTELLDAIYRLPALDDLTPAHPLLRRLTRALIDAGEKIVQSNYRLADQVRRLLDDRTLAESRRAAELIMAIKQQALRHAERPPAADPFIDLEGLPEVQLVMDRPLWEPRAQVQLDITPILEAADDLGIESLRLLYQQFYVDEGLLRRQIETLLEAQPSCTLGEVLERFPVQKGLAELIGYLSIAAGDARHQIDRLAHDSITLPAAGDTAARLIRLPRVVYRSSYAV